MAGRPVAGVPVVGCPTSPSGACVRTSSAAAHLPRCGPLRRPLLGDSSGSLALLFCADLRVRLESCTLLLRCMFLMPFSVANACAPIGFGGAAFLRPPQIWSERVSGPVQRLRHEAGGLTDCRPPYFLQFLLYLASGECNGWHSTIQQSLLGLGVFRTRLQRTLPILSALLRHR